MQDLSLPVISNCEKDGCCSTTEDGNAICLVSKPVESPPQYQAVWHKIRGSVMFAIACALSPCCTVLIIPAVLAILAGTPIAVWMTHNLGIVYGGLTFLSILSFVLAFRWFNLSPKGETKS